MLCRKVCLSYKFKNIVDSTTLISHYNNPVKDGCSWLRLQPLFVSFYTKQHPKNADIFGDISGRKFESFKMDKFENEEEKFQDTEACVPRRLKPSIGQYAQMIKYHVNKKDLNAALEVLNLVKENRDKPTIYMYNLLMRALAIQGNMKKCFYLYNQAKKHALKPNAATYTCLFNACAMSDDELALEQLNKLRISLYEKQVQLNQTNYNALIKAYGWKHQIAEAFAIADEMKDKHIPIEDDTFISLFHAAIADKESGLRHTLVVWHLMYRWRIKRSVKIYNLLLRAIRDTNLGDIKVDDVLLSGYEQTRILLKRDEKPDLLASPPVFSNLLLSAETDQSVERHYSNVNGSTVPQNIPTKLNDILFSNRLILFGGVEGLLNRMADDGVSPDVKTITILLDLIPNTIAAEELLLKISEQKKIQLDIDFFNMLIKRRSMRFDYKAAKEVIILTEQKSLSPNVMTFGVLALGCQECHEAEEFLRGIEAFGYRPNIIIMNTLINIACIKKKFDYLLFVMRYMRNNHMKLSKQAIENVEAFAKAIPTIEKSTGKYRKRKLIHLQENIEKFEQEYSKWQDIIKKESAKQ